MHRFFGVLLLLLGVTRSLSAQDAAESRRLDASLRYMLRPEVRRAVERDTRAGEVLPLAGGIAGRRSFAGEAVRLGVFIRLNDPGALTELRAAGAEIGAVVGDIVSAQVTYAALERIAGSPLFGEIEAAHAVTLQHDSAMLANRADVVRRQVGNTWAGTAGQGVIIGVIDTGIDFRHEDFLTPDGSTRLLGLWDQTRPGNPPAGYSYGFFCSRDAIQQALLVVVNSPHCPQADTNGHGSHTAGSAAGDGSSAGPGNSFRYAGVAPLADLIVVKGGNGSFLENQIIDALHWLEAQARAFDRPMVVNLSLGGQAGPHDGSRLYEKAIDALSRPGFIVVVSSGNEGSNNNLRNAQGNPVTDPLFLIHATGDAIPGSTREFTFEIPPYTPLPGICNDAVLFSFWQKPLDRMAITVVRPGGSEFTVQPGFVETQDHPNGYIYIDNGQSGPRPQNGDIEGLIQVSDCGSGATPAIGSWKIRITTVSGTGQPYHMWLYSNFLGGSEIARGTAGFDNRFIVGSPGNARSAVTVGAYVTRLCWPSLNGQMCLNQREQLGDLARFSSGGPTRDGRMKPEITAPGLVVISVRSSNANQTLTRVTPDGQHFANQGTSMAAPQVTGAIALMLQGDPTLTAEQVRQIFARTATRDLFTQRVYGTDAGATPADWWGYGKLNVAAALCELGSSSIELITLTPSRDTLPRNATVQLEGCAMGTPAPITFRSTNQNVAAVDQSGLVRAIAAGEAKIIGSAGPLADTVEIVVVEPTVLAGSGNSVAPGGATLGKAGTVLPLLALTLHADGVESVRVEQLGFVVDAADPQTRVVVGQDVNGNRVLDDADRVIGSMTRAAGTGRDTLRIPLSDLTIQARDSVVLVAGIRLSGKAPNNAAFSLAWVPELTRSAGARSGERDRVAVGTPVVASTVAHTSILQPGQMLTLSENPVRSDRLVINFADRPSQAAIYTAAGRRVRDFMQLLDNTGSVIWDLQNEQGARVAAGIYLIVFDIGGQLIREKVFITGAGR